MKRRRSMADHSERWVLNRLIEMCRDEELSLRYLADHVHSPEVKTMLLGLADRRANFATELVPHAQRLGGFEPHDGTARGAWLRRWRALRDSVIKHDDQSWIAGAGHAGTPVPAPYR